MYSSQTILHNTVTLLSSPHRAFEMFTVNDMVESWLIRPFNGSNAEIEPRVGGKYELFWNKTDRENDSTIGCRVTAVEPDKLLSFEWKGPKQFKEFMNVEPLTHVVVCFFPVSVIGKPATEVHLIHSGWCSTPEWVQAKDYFERAWGGAFRELEKRVNG